MPSFNVHVYSTIALYFIHKSIQADIYYILLHDLFDYYNINVTFLLDIQYTTNMICVSMRIYYIGSTLLHITRPINVEYDHTIPASIKKNC